MKTLILLLLFPEAFAQNATDPQTLLNSGLAKMQQSAALARERKFGPANDVLAEAVADLDAAVDRSPDSLQIRTTRGSIYSQFPRLYNLYERAIDDLEFLTSHTQFASMPEARQKAILSALEKAKSFRGEPDRFPQVSDNTSPVIAAATVTYPNGGGSVKWIVDTMKDQPGLLGTHVLNSVDQPGMIVILSWWQNKDALNRFFYGQIHQGMIRQAYDRKPGEKRDVTATQVGIELFTSLPGGTQIGGGITPQGAAAK